jgi:tRNA (cmo5U34)-methyltransferase
MQSEHSVSSHLRLDTTEYDRIIRTYIPHYDESRQIQLDLLAAALVPGATQIIDLGGGTGSLAEAILDRFSQCSVLVRDIDREMLPLAQARLARFADRFETELASFDAPFQRVDAVLAAFALHHIRDLREKTEVYRRIREAIRAGGVFLNADAVSGPFWPALRDGWAAFMAGQGFTLEQAYQNLDDWAAEDMYFSVHEELCAMAQAGFEHPECFWRRGPVAIVGARLPRS